MASIPIMSLVFLLWGFPGAHPANGFEGWDATSHPGLTCNASCHTRENLQAAQQNKNTAPSCRACHGAGVSPQPKSPFRSPAAFLPARGIPVSVTRVSQNKSKVSATAKPRAETTNPSPTQGKGAPHPSPFPNMVYIPAGEFIMGSNERWDDEAPEHIASTDAFYIDRYEVTNADYQKFVDATGHEPPYHWPDGQIPKGKERHPVVYVNWFDARDYCQWAGKRLPTEQEWEKAARGEDGLIYPWGNEWDLHKSNNPYKHSTGTEPVASYPNGKSPYGLYDMSGNVWEWVDSYYLPHPGNTVPRAEYGKDKRVLKGGSWFDCLSYGCGLSAPTFNRSFFTPEVRNNSFGFRCARFP